MFIKIKLSKLHPHKKMQFGRHSILPEYQEIELNEDEVKDLKGKGPKAWFSYEQIGKIEKSVDKVASKKVAKIEKSVDKVASKKVAKKKASKKKVSKKKVS